MCLNLRKNNHLPYNDSKIRWKMVCDGFDGLYRGPYRESVIYHPTKWNKLPFSIIPKYWFDTDFGFHVFVTKEDALEGMRCRFGSSIVMKIEVDGFIRSGTFCDFRAETWKKFRFIHE